MFRIVVRAVCGFALAYVALSFAALPFSKRLEGSQVRPAPYRMSELEAADFTRYLDRVMRLKTVISREDSLGHLQTAVAASQECVSLVVTASMGSQPDVFCMLYYERALRAGRGIAQDQTGSFKLLEPLARHDAGSYALDLAEDYLDGSGVAQNKVEAAALVWHVRHGYLYDLTTQFVCEGCDEDWRRVAELTNRLAAGASPEEDRQASLLESGRYPREFALARLRDVIFDLSLICALATTLVGPLRPKKQRRTLSLPQ